MILKSCDLITQSAENFAYVIADFINKRNKLIVSSHSDFVSCASEEARACGSQFWNWVVLVGDEVR